MENLSQELMDTCCQKTKHIVLKFVQISQSQLSSVIKVLEERLPRSGHVYNCAVRLSKSWNEFPIYTLQGNISSMSWILVVLKRPDLDQVISISEPPNPIITPELKQAFTDTKAINWDESFMFSGVGRSVTPFLVEISAFGKGNATFVYPSLCFYISREDALQLPEPVVCSPSNENVTVKRLDEAGVKFIHQNWKHSTEGSLEYMREMVEKHPSCGVYLDGSPISGVATHTEMVYGMTTTAPAHRRKGYAGVCTTALRKMLAKEGYQPTNFVEQRNLASRNLSLKTGMTLSHECDYICYERISSW